MERTKSEGLLGRDRPAPWGAGRKLCCGTVSWPCHGPRPQVSLSLQVEGDLRSSRVTRSGDRVTTGVTNSFQAEWSSACEEEAERVNEAHNTGWSPNDGRESAPTDRQGGVGEMKRNESGRPA